MKLSENQVAPAVFTSSGVESESLEDGDSIELWPPRAPAGHFSAWEASMYIERLYDGDIDN